MLKDPMENDPVKSTPNSATLTEVVRDMPRVRGLLEHGAVQVTSHKRNEFVMLPQSEFERLSALSGTDADGIDGKLRTVLDAVSSMILILDKNLRIRRTNRAFIDYFGYEVSELIGRHLSSLAETASDNYIVTRTQYVLESGVEEAFELASSHRRDRFFRYTIRPWPRGVILFARDITEQSRATERIMQDLAYDQASAHIDGFGSGIVDELGCIRDANLGLARLLKVDRRSLVGVSLYTILSPASRESVENCLQRRGMSTESVIVHYLSQGAEFVKAKLVCSPFSSGRFHFCSAFTIQDPNHCGMLG